MRLDNLNAIANSDYLLTIEGLSINGTPAYFTTFSGVKFSRSSGTYSDGLSDYKRLLEGGTKGFENVTISKPHDPEKDQPVIDFLNTKQDGSRFSFRARPVRRSGTGNDSTFFRGNKSWELDCDLVGWTVVDGIDTQDGTKSVMLTIEFRVENAELK